VGPPGIGGKPGGPDHAGPPKTTQARICVTDNNAFVVAKVSLCGTAEGGPAV
jgi:hypothetical protein